MRLEKAVLGKALFEAIMKHSFYGHRPFRAAFSFKMLANSQDNKDIICKKYQDLTVHKIDFMNM